MSQLDLETRLHDTDDTTQYLPSPPAYFHHWNPFVKHSRRDTKHEDGSLRALSFDAGHFAPIDEAQLRVLQKVLERIGNQLHGETVDLRPSDYFDYFSGAGYGAFNVIFFARLHFTMTEALEAHKIICRELFSIENWINAGLERENALDRALELIFSQFRPTLSLEDWLESDNGSQFLALQTSFGLPTYLPIQDNMTV
ncbi:hypothetical protein DL96DRAFT_908397 [Flagelloscypha sp. PMI_526]|nr:hypothetical protein DL96DRAFT_908397 [Flagelloscypha sp. PMI_526]